MDRRVDDNGGPSELEMKQAMLDVLASPGDVTNRLILADMLEEWHAAGSANPKPVRLGDISPAERERILKMAHNRNSIHWQPQKYLERVGTLRSEGGVWIAEVTRQHMSVVGKRWMVYWLTDEAIQDQLEALDEDDYWADEGSGDTPEDAISQRRLTYEELVCNKIHAVVDNLIFTTSELMGCNPGDAKVAHSVDWLMAAPHTVWSWVCRECMFKQTTRDRMRRALSDGPRVDTVREGQDYPSPEDVAMFGTEPEDGGG